MSGDSSKPKGKRKTKTAPKAMSAAQYLKTLRSMKGVDPESYALFSDPLAAISPVKEWLSTGCIGIDKLTGGGWPVGRIVEVAAWEGVGKTTLLDQSIAAAQQQGAVCVLIDSERARSLTYTETLGVDIDSLIVSRADTLEQGFDAIDRLLAIQEAEMERLRKSGSEAPPILFIWDSIVVDTEAEHEQSAHDNNQPALAARTIKRNLKKFVQRFADARATLVFSNHFYSGIGPFSSLNTYGGGAVKYYTSLRLWLKRVGKLDVGNKTVGHIVEAKLKKTKVCQPREPEQVGLIYGAGLHNAYSLFAWGKKAKNSDGKPFIQSAGSWLSLTTPDGEVLRWQKTFMGFAEILAEHPELYKQLADLYWNSDA